MIKKMRMELEHELRHKIEEYHQVEDVDNPWTKGYIAGEINTLARILIGNLPVENLMNLLKNGQKNYVLLYWQIEIMKMQIEIDNPRKTKRGFLLFQVFVKYSPKQINYEILKNND